MILIAVIEFAIFANMSFTSYFGTVIPFIASIVIGTIQLGATVDYAILMTNKYVKNRKDGLVPKEAMRLSLQDSISLLLLVLFVSLLRLVELACSLILR